MKDEKLLYFCIRKTKNEKTMTNIVMGMPVWTWVIFYVMVLLMLWADLKLFGRNGQHEVGMKEAIHLSLVWIGVSLLFCLGVWLFYPAADPHEKAMEFLAAYVIEKSLSMDNLFVILMLFTYFGIPRKYQHEVLFWGIFGALVLRSVFIFAGAAVVQQFEWVLGIFGIFLLYTGMKMFAHHDEQNADPSKNLVVRWFRKLFPVTSQLHGEKFFIREGGKLLATPLVVALLVIETSDIAFAVDSIPTVFSVSRDPFIILTSNIFAILGMRALYFALAAISKYFRFLNYGLGIILIFVGMKLLLAMNEYINDIGSWMGVQLNVPHVEISASTSLAVIFGVLAVSMLSSVLIKKK